MFLYPKNGIYITFKNIIYFETPIILSLPPTPPVCLLQSSLLPNIFKLIMHRQRKFS